MRFPFAYSDHRGMASYNSKNKSGRDSVPDALVFFAGVLMALVLVWALWCLFTTPTADSVSFSGDSVPARRYAVAGVSAGCNGTVGFDRLHDPAGRNFYDDPDLSYTIDKPVRNWDEKRRRWLEQHPSFIPGFETRILMVTGSQAKPCRNQVGDHLLLRLFKNKVDYCRIHGYEIFYNNVLFQPEMFSFWAKVPTVRAVMLAHPEAEWIWWVDSDAAITDMDFKLPLDRYKDHNLVVHGWVNLIFEKKSWTSVNAGVFLIRNCQWSMDFMDAWAKMGPQSPEYDRWGEIQRSTFKDKSLPESDDQSGLIYLILKESEKWGNKIYVESQYYFEGYWLEIVETLQNISDRYLGIEKQAGKLRRRHAEKVSESYATVWEEYLKDSGYGKFSWRRPFITHFTGCQPCSGDHNQAYSGQVCGEAMHKALNFADNQLLRRYGFVHRDLQDTSTVVPIPFDYPA